jgi:hypothetical protein
MQVEVEVDNIMVVMPHQQVVQVELVAVGAVVDGVIRELTVLVVPQEETLHQTVQTRIQQV